MTDKRLPKDPGTSKAAPEPERADRRYFLAHPPTLNALDDLLVEIMPLRLRVHSCFVVPGTSSYGVLLERNSDTAKLLSDATIADTLRQWEKGWKVKGH